MGKTVWVKFDMDGLAAMEDALEAVEADIRNNAARQAGRAALEGTEKRMKQYAPRDSSGLYDSIKRFSTSNPKRMRGHLKDTFMVAGVRAGTSKRKPPQEEGAPGKGPTGHQALQVEFGATVKFRGQLYVIPPRPFVRPAIVGRERVTLHLFKKHLGRSVKRASLKQHNRNKKRMKK